VLIDSLAVSGKTQLCGIESGTHHLYYKHTQQQQWRYVSDQHQPSVVHKVMVHCST
jgi:hypothetical protein